MSEYMENTLSLNWLVPSRYVVDEAGQLTEKVRRNLLIHLLFLMRSKSSPIVLLLQVLDDGRFRTDVMGALWAKDTIIIKCWYWQASWLELLVKKSYQFLL